MNKKAARRYNPRIGNMLVDFLDYRTQRGIRDLVDAVHEYSADRDLVPQDTYDLALMLHDHGYEINPGVFTPEYVSSPEHSPSLEKELSSAGELEKQHGIYTVYDDYEQALREGRYEDAHQIYESMSPAEQQAIKDRSRRGSMADNLQKLAQEEIEAVLEKEVPAEPAVESVPMVRKNPRPQRDDLEIIARGQELIDNYHDMNLPPQSMVVFMSFGQALDNLKRSREKPEFDRAEMQKRFEDYLNKYGKVLRYLQDQGYDVTEDLNMIKRYADIYFERVPGATSRVAARRMLALASRLQEKGNPSAARRLLKIIRSQEVGQNKASLEHFRDLLAQEDYEKAREVYLGLDPIDRKKADDIATLYHSANTILRLRDIGQSLFDKGRYVEAGKIDRMIKAQFVELPQEMQHQVIFLIVPEGEHLPQAFRSTEDAEKNTKMMEERMTNMKNRLTPKDVCSPHCANIVPRLLRLADKLDAEGKIEEATMLDNWLKKLAQSGEAEDLLELGKEFGLTPKKKKNVRRGKCPGCGTDVLFDPDKGGVPPCAQCKKDPWGYGRRASLTSTADTESSKPAKVIEIADAIRRDNPDISDETAYRMAWETYCSYTNKNYPGCTEKGKSMRESPKPYEKSSSIKQAGEKGEFEIECEECGDWPLGDIDGDEQLAAWTAEAEQFFSGGLTQEAKKGKGDGKSKYVSEEGHFKGKKGSGERWKNCVRYQQSKGKSKESAEKICGYIYWKNVASTQNRLEKKADDARKKYVSEEGHFKGREGSGERWDNCIKYQMSKGHSKEAAEKICGYIKSRKGS